MVGQNNLMLGQCSLIAIVPFTLKAGTNKLGFTSNMSLIYSFDLQFGSVEAVPFSIFICVINFKYYVRRHWNIMLAIYLYLFYWICSLVYFIVHSGNIINFFCVVYYFILTPPVSFLVLVSYFLYYGSLFLFLVL